MKNTLIILFFLLSTTIGATTYYIDPSGSNSNNGSSGSRWKTLAYACSKATASGDIVHVNTGTYIETTQIFLPTGVSIEGDGANSIIQSRVTSSGSFFLMLHSGSENTNGNQHISNVTFDGGATTAYGGVSILNRGNVIVHHCIFRDFLETGIQFNDGGNVPVTRAVGNQFYNNTVTNCSRATNTGFNTYGRGGLRVGGQQGMLIHDNILTQKGRASGANGYVIKYGGEGWNRGMKIYNNTITRDVTDGTFFQFSIELTHEEGLEFYNNTVTGALDINFVTLGTSSYGLYCHNNTFSNPASVNVVTSGLILEFNIESAIVKNNHFKNLGIVIHFSTRAGYDLKNNTFANNICENIGVVGSTAGRFTTFVVVDSPSTSSDGFYVYNNVIQGRPGGGAAWGINIPSGEYSTNNIVRNNIITNFTNGGITANPASSINGLIATNNILYNNGNNNNPFFAGGTPSTYTYSGNQNVNPLFVSSSDFHLQSSSPAITKGINVGLGTDYDGKSWNTTPSIGAFEYNSTLPSPAVPVYQSSVVENATPSLLEMTYSLTLANIVPSASSFSILVNSVARTISAISVSNTKVQLTLASPLGYGDVVSVAYNRPSTNQLQTSSGGQAITITPQTVSNKVNVVLPVYVSSSVANATPALLEMTYNMTLANKVPVTTTFSVLVNSVARAINSVVLSGTKVKLTLSSRVVSGDILTVSYTKPAINPMQTTSGGVAISIPSQPVINNCINVAPTAVITSPVINSTFAPLASVSITASALDADGSIRLVEYYTGSTKLGSSSTAPYAFTWNNVALGNYYLTVVATDNLYAKTTSSPISISVISNKYTPNSRPIVKISNPHKGISYEHLATLTIDAIASDPDGTVSKVEFFNGLVKLVEFTSAPYTYTWKDLAVGSYSITAIATDNLSDTTISSPVEFIISAKVMSETKSDIIKLYPNPNDGHFSVEFSSPLLNEKGEILITDLAGKQVYNGPVLQEEMVKHFDLSNSKSGVYVMMIRDKEILITKKFIKK